MNKVMLIGNLGQDPDTRYLDNGDAVSTISVATNRRWKDKTSGEQKSHTEWHRCVAFGKRAETIAKYLRKGSKIFVEGEMRTRKWQDKDGQDKWTTEVRIDNFEFLDKKEAGERPPHPADEPYNTGEGKAPDTDQDGLPPQSRTDADDSKPPPDDFDDDIPF